VSRVTTTVTPMSPPLSPVRHPLHRSGVVAATARALVVGVVVALASGGCAAVETLVDGSEPDGASSPDESPDLSDRDAGLATEEGPGVNVSGLDLGEQGAAVEVLRTIDGDSLEVLSGSGELEVRLLGINAPERFSLDNVETCAGIESRLALESLLESGRSITMVGTETDRFGRTLGDLRVDGRSVDAAMVESGWALALWSAEDQTLTDLMRDAAGQGRGWWGSACGETATGLVISDEQADSPGDDRENLAEEWVEITNEGSHPVDLDGWMIRDDATSNRFRLNDLVLRPGDVVRIHTGSGPSGSGSVFLGEDFPVWSNRGETVLLVDPDGVIATHAFIEGRR